ncbi:MAG: hypothetical protein ACK4SO_03360, partial [Candidatus Kapaibacteriota bacterium]
MKEKNKIFITLIILTFLNTSLEWSFANETTIENNYPMQFDTNIVFKSPRPLINQDFNKPAQKKFWGF